MRQLRPGPNCSRFPDRGAKGGQEGAQGVAAEEALDGGEEERGIGVEKEDHGCYVHYGQSLALAGFFRVS